MEVYRAHGGNIKEGMVFSICGAGSKNGCRQKRLERDDTLVVNDEQIFFRKLEDLDQGRGDWEEAQGGKHSR